MCNKLGIDKQISNLIWKWLINRNKSEYWGIIIPFLSLLSLFLLCLLALLILLFFSSSYFLSSWFCLSCLSFYLEKLTCVSLVYSVREWLTSEVRLMKLACELSAPEARWISRKVLQMSDLCTYSTTVPFTHSAYEHTIVGWHSLWKHTCSFTTLIHSSKLLSFGDEQSKNCFVMSLSLLLKCHWVEWRKAFQIKSWNSSHKIAAVFDSFHNTM